MRQLILLGVIGFLAELVGGALGMGYGVATTSMLLMAGVLPAAASAAVHMAEIGTYAASGVAHWRFHNVDWKLTALLSVPGSVGAFIGALVLSLLSTRQAAPVMATILLLLGLYILVRFALKPARPTVAGRAPNRVLVLLLGLFGGFIDATGGGGWGSVTTSTLLFAGRTEPRLVVGSVDASKFFVSVAATLGFLVSMPAHSIPWGMVLALLIGGVLAAPISAWLARFLPAALLGTFVGGFVTFLSLRVILQNSPWWTQSVVWSIFGIGFVAALAIGARRMARGRPVG